MRVRALVQTLEGIAAILLLSGCSQYKAILDATAAFEDVRVVWVIVAFADYIGAAELELRRQGGLAGPLNVFGAVLGARVATLHRIDRVDAGCIATNACQLWYGIQSAVRGVLAIAESQSLDVRE